MRSVYLLFALAVLSSNCHAFNFEKQSDNEEFAEPSLKSIHFFKSQVTNNRSIGGALRSLLTRYPEKTTEFVSIAFSAYPEDYEEIIATSVTANPTFVDEIIMVAIYYQVAKPAEITEIAVNAEPSYAGVATSAACESSPAYFGEIVKAAVLAQPDSADQIAQKLVKAFPNKTIEILVTTIKEVPFVGKYVLDALLATVVNDPEMSQDMIIISVEQLAQYPDAMERLVELAHQRKIEAGRIKESAIRGGLVEAEAVAVIDKYY
jgi:hypothetical protein